MTSADGSRDRPPGPARLALVAEGSEAANRVVRQILAGLGIRHVVEARDGAELLGAFGERRPDLIVLDWRQPILSASEVITFARDPARSHAPDLPVLVTMSGPSRADVDAALALRVSGIVAKPCSTRILRHRLQAVLTPTP